MEGVWYWKHIEDRGFLKEMCLTFNFKEGGPGCTCLWRRKQWPSVPGLRAPHCPISSWASPSRWFPKQGTADGRTGVRKQSLRTGVGTQSLCLEFRSPGQTYLVFPFSCPQTPLWRTLSIPPRMELTKKPLLSFGEC